VESLCPKLLAKALSAPQNICLRAYKSDANFPEAALVPGLPRQIRHKASAGYLCVSAAQPLEVPQLIFLSAFDRTALHFFVILKQFLGRRSAIIVILLSLFLFFFSFFLLQNEQKQRLWEGSMCKTDPKLPIS